MTKEKKKKNGKLSNRAVTVILVIILLIGLSVLCYPSVSNWWNERVHSRAINTYTETVSNLTEKDYTQLLEEAQEYNEKLYKIGSVAAISQPDLVKGYEDTLNVTENGMMGYVTIEKLNVELPIYHGTSNAVLNAGAGHLEGSSLPIGGENTHSVISAHRGLPSAKLFTDLDEMEEGDIFTITILGEVLYYEVDQISIVLPTEPGNLYIESGKDYCTLMTCTPYGINTHRLLVRGVRIDNPDDQHIHISANAYRINTTVVAGIIAIPLLVLALILFLLATNDRRKKKKKVDLSDYGIDVDINTDNNINLDDLENRNKPPGE